MLLTTNHSAVEQSPLTAVPGPIRVGDSRPGVKPQDSGQMVSGGSWNRNRRGRPRLLEKKVGCVTQLPISPALARRRRRLLTA
jgi:hypothetical protein